MMKLASRKATCDAWKGLLDLSFELEVLQQILTREHELAADWSEE
jgi:hypothetical protein